MLGLDNPLHIAVVVVVLLLLFGARRLPEIGQSLGTGLREFKRSVTGESEADAVVVPGVVAQPAVAAVQPVAVAQPAVVPVQPVAVAQPAVVPVQPVAGVQAEPVETPATQA
jgi:sec-independent protein translocase protein TatA